MSENLIIKYFPANEFTKEPFQATEDATDSDVFASEAKTILPKTVVVFFWTSRWQFQKVSMAKIFRPLVFLDIT